MCVGLLPCFNGNFIFHTGQCAELSFDNNAVIMCIFHNLSGEGNVVLKGLGGCIDHNRSKSAVNAGFAQFKSITMVKVQSNRNFGVELYGSLNKLHKISVVRISTGALGNLKDHRALQLACCFGNTLDDLHVIDVECADCISAVICLCKHFFCGYECHFFFSLHEKFEIL